jgi:hypothetical protein
VDVNSELGKTIAGVASRLAKPLVDAKGRNPEGKLAAARV